MAMMAPSSGIEAPPKTREELADLLKHLQFDKKIVKLEVHLAMSIEVSFGFEQERE